MLADFAINNKVHSTTEVSPFMANYSRKLKIEIDLRRKRKNGEDNRVCGKNEKSVRKGWDSISESTKRNEEASR